MATIYFTASSLDGCLDVLGLGLADDQLGGDPGLAGLLQQLLRLLDVRVVWPELVARGGLHRRQAQFRRLMTSLSEARRT